MFHSVFRLDENGEEHFYLGNFPNLEAAETYALAQSKLRGLKLVAKKGYDPSWEPILMTKKEMEVVGFHISNIPAGEMGTWGWQGALKTATSAEQAAGIAKTLPPSFRHLGGGEICLAFYRGPMTAENLTRASRNLADQYERITGSRYFRSDQRSQPDEVGSIFYEESQK